MHILKFLSISTTPSHMFRHTLSYWSQFRWFHFKNGMCWIHEAPPQTPPSGRRRRGGTRDGELLRNSPFLENFLRRDKKIEQIVHRIGYLQRFVYEIKFRSEIIPRIYSYVSVTGGDDFQEPFSWKLKCARIYETEWYLSRGLRSKPSGIKSNLFGFIHTFLYSPRW